MKIWIFEWRAHIRIWYILLVWSVEFERFPLSTLGYSIQRSTWADHETQAKYFRSTWKYVNFDISHSRQQPHTHTHTVRWLSVCVSKVEVSVPSNVLKSHRNVYKIVYLRSMLSISCFHFGFLSTSLILGTDCFLLCVACVCILFSLSYSCFCVQSTVFCSDFFFIFVLLVRLPLFNFQIGIAFYMWDGVHWVREPYTWFHFL